MKFYLVLSIVLCLILTNGNAQSTSAQKEILLIGVFHFNNPGADLAKTDKFNVLDAQAQKELEQMAVAIKKFAPDKIFTEWNYNEQPGLDSLYELYLKDKYFEYVNKRYPGDSFFKENEIFQLGFRIAKKSGLKRVYGIDISTQFPFDSLMLAIDKAHQEELKKAIFERIKKFETLDNEARKKYGLTKLIIENNKQSHRNFDLGSYITFFNPGGQLDDFIGADLVAGWYRRNLLMYSFVQKITEKKDKKLVVILGAGHIALLKHFIDLDENYKVVELEEVLR
jgi:hypothetical protein